MSSISNQVLDSVSGKATKLFKDNVFVNQAGQLFSIGQSLHGSIANLKNLKGNVKSLAMAGVTGLVNDKITGIISASSIGSVFTNVGQVTNIYKNVMAGNITGITQITSLAKKFGIGTGASGFLSSGAAGGASLAKVGFASSFKSVLGGFQKSIGSFASAGIKSIGKFFGGGGGGWTPGVSDIRLKEEIQLIGRSQSGINIYRFKYKFTDGMYEGVMAQEVPWAAELTDSGYYIVDYNKVDVEFRRLN